MSFLIPILMYIQVLIPGAKSTIYEFDDIIKQYQTQSKQPAMNMKSNVLQSFINIGAIEQKRNKAESWDDDAPKPVIN